MESVCSERYSKVRQAGNYGTRSRNAETFVLTWFVGIADALDASEAGAFNVGDRVANECAASWIGIQYMNGLLNQVRVWFETIRVVICPRNYQFDALV
jgi:hypothetical protein